MNTRAGMLIGKFVTPGISGISLYLSALLLWLKGCRIKAFYPVDLPSNWISLHPGLNNRTVEFIYNKTLPQIRKFTEDSFDGKRNFWSVKEIVIDALVAPIALLYYMVGRFIIAKTFYASRDCNFCDACVKNCPVKAIKKVDGRLFWTFRCESCMRCMCNCPQRAIETAHGTLLCLSIFFGSILNTLVYRSFNLTFVDNNSMLNFVFESALFLFVIAVWYRIFHFLLRFRWFERFTVYTSLTKFSWWSRYKGWKVK